MMCKHIYKNNIFTHWYPKTPEGFICCICYIIVFKHFCVLFLSFCGFSHLALRSFRYVFCTLLCTLLCLKWLIGPMGRMWPFRVFLFVNFIMYCNIYNVHVTIQRNDLLAYLLSYWEGCSFKHTLLVVSYYNKY